MHAIWIDPANSESRDHRQRRRRRGQLGQTKTWNFVQNIPVGLFYHVSYDMATPYNVCGGMQDNYDWCGPSAVRGAAGIAVQLVDDAGRRRLRGDSGSARLPHRLQRIAGRQHGPHRTVTGETNSDPAAARNARRAARCAGTGTRR